MALRHVGSSWTRDRISVSCIDRQILYYWDTRDMLQLSLSASVTRPSYFDGVQTRPPPSMSLKCIDSFEIKLLWKQCKKKALTLLCPHECQKYISHGKKPYLHQKDGRHRECEIRNSRPRKLCKQISFVTSVVFCPKQNPLCFVKFSQIFFVCKV